MEKEVNVLGISKISYTDFNVYGICGIGEDCDKFYNEVLPLFKYKKIRFDMPWNYIGFYSYEDDQSFQNNEFVKQFLYDGEQHDAPFKLKDWK
jgi:hypothetical protein